MSSPNSGDFSIRTPRVRYCGLCDQEYGKERPVGFSLSVFPSFLSEFSAGAKIGLVSRLLRGHEVPLHGLTRRQRVDWVSGAAFMAQFPALKAVDFFDADYFLYFEETDMMRRIGKSGWEIWYCPEAQVDHAAGASTGMSSEKGSRSADPRLLVRQLAPVFREEPRGVLRTNFVPLPGLPEEGCTASMLQPSRPGTRHAAGISTRFPRSCSWSAFPVRPGHALDQAVFTPCSARSSIAGRDLAAAVSRSCA